jgi:hypothetical protein
MSGFIGIDVSQDELVVGREGQIELKTYPNTDRGIDRLISEPPQELADFR